MYSFFTAESKLNILRQAIYLKFGVSLMKDSKRSKELRKRCTIARSVDLRKRSDVIWLCQQLRIIKTEMNSQPFVNEGEKNKVVREMDRIRNIDFSGFFKDRSVA